MRQAVSFLIGLFLLLLLVLSFWFPSYAQSPTSTPTATVTPASTPLPDYSAYKLYRTNQARDVIISVDNFDESGCLSYHWDSGIPAWHQYFTVLPADGSAGWVVLRVASVVQKPHAYYSTYSTMSVSPFLSPFLSEMSRLDCVASVGTYCDRNDNSFTFESDWHTEVITYTSSFTLTGVDDLKRFHAFDVSAGTATQQAYVPALDVQFCILSASRVVVPTPTMTPTPTGTVMPTLVPSPTVFPTPTPIPPPFEITPPDHYTCYVLIPGFQQDFDVLGYSFSVDFPGFEVCLAPYTIRLSLFGVDWFAVAAVMVAFGGVAALYSRFK